MPFGTVESASVPESNLPLHSRTAVPAHPVTALPPLLAGGAHVSIAVVWLAAFSEGAGGGFGGVAAVVASSTGPYMPLPASLLAHTRNRYTRPLCGSRLQVSRGLQRRLFLYTLRCAMKEAYAQ